MAIREILVWPSKKLAAPSLRIENVADVSDLIWDLMDTMADKRGAGIAAPQVGELVNLFLIAPPIAPPRGHQIFINPEITWVSKEKELQNEGCLSFPDIWIAVERPKECKVKALDEEGSEFEVKADGIYARAMQHEFDHLSGALIIDFVGKVKRDMVRKKLKRKKR